MATNGRIDDEGIKLLKEARRIIKSSLAGRISYRDYLQRSGDYLRKKEKDQP